MNKQDQLLSAFTDPHRVRILNMLAQRDCCLCEFQMALPLARPEVSRHLARLRRSGFVETRRAGQWMIYSLGIPQSQVLEILAYWFGGIRILKQDVAAMAESRRAMCEQSSRRDCGCETLTKVKVA